MLNMLQPLNIAGSRNNPEVTLDKDNNVFSMSGRSIVEDPSMFYMPIYKWLNEYIKNPNPDTEFYIDLEYFNSSSARQIMKLIILLENVQDTNNKVKVVWLFEEGDEMSEEKGEEIKIVSKLDFELREYPSEDFVI